MARFTIRVLRGRQKRISKWFVEIDKSDGGPFFLEENGVPAQFKSKQIAQKAAWDWAKLMGVERDVVFIVPVQD